MGEQAVDLRSRLVEANEALQGAGQGLLGRLTELRELSRAQQAITDTKKVKRNLTWDASWQTAKRCRAGTFGEHAAESQASLTITFPSACCVAAPLDGFLSGLPLLQRLAAPGIDDGRAGLLIWCICTSPYITDIPSSQQHACAPPMAAIRSAVEAPAVGEDCKQA